MYREAFEIMNKIKDPKMKKVFQSHGLKEDSLVYEVMKNLSKNEEMMNSTEPRMTLYSAEINQYLYPQSDFIMKSENDANFAASGEVRKLQDSVIGPNVTKGRFAPLTLSNNDNAPQKTVKIRKNLSQDWAIEYFHTDPTVLSMETSMEVPYEARQEQLKAHADILRLSIGNFAAVEWAQGVVGTATSAINIAAGNDFFVFTSGSAQRQNSVPNNTGNVRKITKQDLQNVQKAFQRQQISRAAKMYCLPTVEQYSDMLDIPDFVDYEKTGRQSKLIMGEVGMLYGITILDPRHREDWNANVLYTYTAAQGSGTAATTTLTKVEDTASPAANMTSAALFWCETMVKRAQGSAIVFPWNNSPIYMGDVYAVEQRFGAVKKRLDRKGVVMLLDNPFTS